MLGGILRGKREIKFSKTQVNMIKVLPLTYRTHQKQGHLISVTIPITEGPSHPGLPQHSSESHNCRAVQTWPGELPGIHEIQRGQPRI